MRYASQREPSLVNLLQRAGGFFLLGAGLLIAVTLRFGSDLAAFLSIILLALGIACLWTLRQTWYEITPKRLRIRCGPSRMAIPWEKLQRISYSEDRRNAPALSFRRLRIDYKQGKRPRTVLISPQDQEEFLKEVCAQGRLHKEGNAYVRRQEEAATNPSSVP